MQTRLPPRISGSTSVLGATSTSSVSAEGAPKVGAKLNSGVGIAGLILPERKQLITPQRTLAPVRITSAAEGGDSDPVTHLNYLAGPECMGRGSPSPGFDKASAYVAALMKKYGMEGANPSDPSGNPYYQTFSVFSRGGDDVHFNKKKWGHSQFDRGFFLDNTLSEEELQRIRNTVSRGSSKAKAVDLSTDALKKAGFESGNVQNVMGIMRGTGPHKDEYIVIMSHLDHLGVRRGQTYWGADDNASGSSTNASTIEGLAALQKAGKLDRSVLVIFSAAEELGLVGANYFVKHIPAGIKKENIKGAFNNDMVGRLEVGRISAIPTTEGNRTFLTDCFERANDMLGDRKFHVDYDLAEYENRQDGWAFTHAGIPTAFFYEGLVDGHEMEDYHRPTDTADKIIRDNGGEKIRRLRDLTTYAVQLASNTTINDDGTWTLPKSE